MELFTPNFQQSWPKNVTSMRQLLCMIAHRMRKKVVTGLRVIPIYYQKIHFLKEALVFIEMLAGKHVGIISNLQEIFY